MSTRHSTTFPAAVSHNVIFVSVRSQAAFQIALHGHSSYPTLCDWIQRRCVSSVMHHPCKLAILNSTNKFPHCELIWQRPHFTGWAIWMHEAVRPSSETVRKQCVQTDSIVLDRFRNSVCRLTAPCLIFARSRNSRNH